MLTIYLFIYLLKTIYNVTSEGLNIIQLKQFKY